MSIDINGKNESRCPELKNVKKLKMSRIIVKNRIASPVRLFSLANVTVL